VHLGGQNLKFPKATGKATNKLRENRHFYGKQFFGKIDFGF